MLARAASARKLARSRRTSATPQHGTLLARAPQDDFGFCQHRARAHADRECAGIQVQRAAGIQQHQGVGAAARNAVWRWLTSTSEWGRARERRLSAAAMSQRSGAEQELLVGAQPQRRPVVACRGGSAGCLRYRQAERCARSRHHIRAAAQYVARRGRKRLDRGRGGDARHLSGCRMVCVTARSTIQARPLRVIEHRRCHLYGDVTSGFWIWSVWSMRALPPIPGPARWSDPGRRCDRTRSRDRWDARAVCPAAA